MNRRNQHQQAPQHHSTHVRVQALDQRCYAIYVEMARLRASEMALTKKWQVWQQQRIALDHEKGQVFAQGILSAFGGPKLLPDAQNWHYRNQNLQRAENRLKLEGIAIQSALEAYEAELYLINLEIDMLISYP